MRGEFRALAEEHHLDPRVAEAMVDEGLGVPGLLDKGKLLHLEHQRGAHGGLRQSGSRQPGRVACGDWAPWRTVVGPLETNWAEALVRFVTNPLVAPLLLSLGMLGLIFEIKTGAFGLGGVLSLVSLGLFSGVPPGGARRMGGIFCFWPGCWLWRLKSSSSRVLESPALPASSCWPFPSFFR